MTESQLSPGVVVDGAYTLDAVVRSRAGATTYAATNTREGADAVWVTIYDGRCFPSGLALERSLRELRQLKSVHSPRVLRVIDAGKHGDGVFEVTEPGPSATLVEHLQQGSLSMEDAAALVVQVGEALLEGQRVGVIHRNLGADVVFPSPEGARVGGFAVGEPQERGAGPLLTIAPEQVQGKVVDQRTLIYNVAALMQWMLSGEPMFSGDPAGVLSAHEGQVPDESIEPGLRRALGKDPRMRPMMLKQFLGDIAEMGGVEPPTLSARVAAPSVGVPTAPIAAPKAPDAAVSRPSNRGWTMFMKAQEEPEEKAPEPAPPPSKPSTRGWTMFMKAQDDGTTPEQEAASPESPPESPPETSSETPPESGAGPALEGAPSTRGWTMFMKGGEGEDPSATESGAEEEPAPGGSDPASPSSRGWTMFTKDDENEGDENEVDENEVDENEGEAAPPTPADPASPSTRGWTMFTKDEDEAEPSPAPEPPVESTANDDADADADADAAPTSRGWTMFMEPGAKPSEAPQGDDAPASGSDVPAPGADEDAEAEPAPGKKRGWTMFMNAPIEELAKPGAASETEQDAAPAESAPPPAANVEAADQKGWTVFGAPAPQRAEGSTTPAAQVPPPDSDEVEAAPGASSRRHTVATPGDAPSTVSRETVEVAAAGTATVVDTHAPTESDSGGTPVQRGKTVVMTQAGGAPAEEKPDTMYFKKGEVEPEGGISARAPTVRDVPSPARPVEERVAGAETRPGAGSSVPAVPEPTDIEPAKSPNKALIAIGGAVVVVAGVAAYFAFG